MSVCFDRECLILCLIPWLLLNQSSRNGVGVMLHSKYVLSTTGNSMFSQVGVIRAKWLRNAFGLHAESFVSQHIQRPGFAICKTARWVIPCLLCMCPIHNDVLLAHLCGVKHAL